MTKKQLKQLIQEQLIQEQLDYKRTMTKEMKDFYNDLNTACRKHNWKLNVDEMKYVLDLVAQMYTEE